VPSDRISKQIGQVIRIHSRTIPHLSRTTHQWWVDWKVPRCPWTQMSSQHWLHHFFWDGWIGLCICINRLFDFDYFNWSVVWNDLLLHTFSKKPIKSRVGNADMTRCLGSVLLPITYFRTLMSEGPRTVLSLAISRLPDFGSQVVRVRSKPCGLMVQTVRQ
jgi:hypothetical protein